MIFTSEQPAKARAAKSAEELLALAKAEGVALTEAEAAKSAELNEGELEQVSGGGVSLDAELDDDTLNLYATAKDNATSANTRPAGFSFSDNGTMQRTGGRF